MDKIRPMTDMAFTAEDRKNDSPLNGCYPMSSDLPKYPYGLCISLTNKELEKLKVDHSDWDVGDMFHLHAMAKITSVSSREDDKGSDDRIEMQIIALSGENEEEENQADDDNEDQVVNIKKDMMRKAIRSPY